MKIETGPDLTGFGGRDDAWTAVDSDTYDYDQPVGRGATEDGAVADLLDKLEARRAKARDLEREQRVNELFAGWAFVLATRNGT